MKAIENADKKMMKLAMEKVMQDNLNKKMKQLTIGEIIMLEGRIYKVEWSKWQNGKMQGNRAMLRLLKERELMGLIIDKEKQNA